MQDNDIKPIHKWFFRCWFGFPFVLTFVLLCYWAYMEL